MTTEEIHQATVSGPEESHTIHAIRATTVIFEEDSVYEEDQSEVTQVANIILPNRPHQSALQVEEVGSYQLESHLAVEAVGSLSQRGIVDDVDSDCGSYNSSRLKTLYSRNVSIVSAASEDESSAKSINGGDVETVISYTKSVIDEQEVVHQVENPVESNINLKPQTASYVKSEEVESSAQTVKAGDVETTISFTKTVIEEQEVVHLEENPDEVIVSLMAQTIETNDETDESKRQSRIKDIRAKARKASLASRESAEEVFATTDERQFARTESTASDKIGKQQVASRESAEEVSVTNERQYARSDSSVGDTNTEKRARLLDEIVDDVEDEELAKLLKRGREQRQALSELQRQTSEVLNASKSSSKADLSRQTSEVPNASKSSSVADISRQTSENVAGTSEGTPLNTNITISDKNMF